MIQPKEPFTDEEFSSLYKSKLECLQDNQIIEISKDKITIKKKDKSKVFIHSEDGPAVIYKNGREEWYVNGKRHRSKDKPAVVSKSIQIWYKHGKRHRIKDAYEIYQQPIFKDELKRPGILPATIHLKDNEVYKKEFWVEGNLKSTIDENYEIVYEDNNIKSLINLKDHSQTHFSPEGKTVYISNDIGRFWFKDNKMHGEGDSPASIYYNDVVIWAKNGVKHRDNGPAMEFNTGVNKWYHNGQLHRIDGPAIERPNGDNEWYEYGKFIKCSRRITKIKKLVRTHSTFWIIAALPLFFAFLFVFLNLFFK